MKTVVYSEAAMSSLIYLRELMCQRLNSAAEEIFGVFEKIVADYEEEVNRQRRLLDIVCQPELQPGHIEEDVDPTDLQLCNQERSSSLDQEEPESLQIQEEQEGIDTDHEGESSVLLPEMDSFMLTHVNEGSDHRGSDSDSWTLSECSSVAESEESTPHKRRRRKKLSPKSKSEKRFKCDTCEKTYGFKSQLKIHMRVHTGEKPHVCKLCGKGCSRKYTLKQHMLTHRDNKERGSSLVQEEPQSLQSQEGEQPVPKPQTVSDRTEAEPEPASDQQPLSNSSPVAESRDQTGSESKPQKGSQAKKSDNRTKEKTEICGTCGKSFMYLCLLKAHQRVHTREKPFVCKICRKAYSSKYTLMSHMVTHEDDMPRNHYLSHTNTGEKRFKCDTCGKFFTGWSRLNRHLRIHTDERPHVCQMCRKGFKHKHELTKHMVSHMGEQPFPWDSYLSESTSDTQTGEKPFKCHNCRTAYSSLSHLILHQGKYAKKKRYACKPCFEYFKFREASKSHNAGADTVVEANVCKICGKKVATPAGLVIHMRRHRDEKP